MLAKIAGLSALLAIYSSAAYAADPVEQPMGAAYDWTGFYAGLGFGSELGVSKLDVNGLFEFDGLGAQGIFGEATIGYDYMFSNGFVIGAMLNGRIANTAFEVDTPIGDFDAEGDFSIDVVGRVGYALTPSTLGYVLGGYTYQSIELPDIVTAIGIDDDLDLHGYVVGVGMETALSNHFTVRNEYRFRQYDDETLIGPLELEQSVHAFHTTLAYRFGSGFSRPIAVPVDTDWSGFYIGAAGFAGGFNTGIDLNFGPVAIDVDGIGGEGVGGELQIGYDHDFGSFVAGIQLSGRIGNTATNLELGGFNLDIEADYGFDALLRAGYEVGPATLAYVIGGYSYQHVDVSSPIFNDNYDLDGLTIGTGVEAAVTEHLSASLEYRYTFYEDVDFDLGPGADLSFKPNSQTARLGLKYKF